MRTPPRVEPWVIKALTAALIVIALALVAIAVLLLIGLSQLTELIDALEQTGAAAAAMPM